MKAASEQRADGSYKPQETADFGIDRIHIALGKLLI